MSENVDLRVERSRMFLKKALKELLAEKDLDAITVGEVADRAMVNRSTFYAHFLDKDDLFQAVVQDDLREQLATRLGESDSIGPQSLRALAEVVFTYVEAHGPTCLPNAQPAPNPIILPVQATVVDLLMEWASPADGEECQTSETGRMIATTLSWTIVGAALNWTQHGAGRSQPLDEALGVMMPLVLHGVEGLSVEV